MTRHHKGCPLCGSPQIKKKYSDDRFPIWQCSCGAVFLCPFPSQDELDVIYGKTYYENGGAEEGKEDQWRQMKHLTFKARMKEIHPFVRKGKVLDVGCATGSFLEVADAEGWEVYGLERSPYASRVARRKFGDRIYEGILEDAHYADETFDFITLSDLLEHIRDLQSFMREVFRILKSSGFLMIETPNVASLSCRLMGGRWVHYKAEHLYYFSPDTLRELLVRHDFTPLRIGVSSKYVNPAYIIDRFRRYHHPVFSPLMTWISRYLPQGIKQITFPMLCGKMTALAKKNS